jgi:carboxypeptidase D
MTCLNVYDFRLRDPYPECGMAWPPILPNVYSYLAVSVILNDSMSLLLIS